MMPASTLDLLFAIYVLSRLSGRVIASQITVHPPALHAGAAIQVFNYGFQLGIWLGTLLAHFLLPFFTLRPCRPGLVPPACGFRSHVSAFHPASPSPPGSARGA